MTKLKQLNPNYPNGDCMRTVLACLLNFKDPLMIPNFTEMENYEKNWTKNIYEWLNQRGLKYLEISFDEFSKSPFIPDGLCTIVGKSPRGDYNHIVIGEIKNKENGDRELFYKWDTSPLHDGKFLDDIKYIGFLSQDINFNMIDIISKMKRVD